MSVIRRRTAALLAIPLAVTGVPGEAMTTATAHRVRTDRPGSPLVLISAWAVPVLVLGQFAMLAVIPVALVLIGSLRNTRDRALHRWAATLTVAYAVPLALWAIGPDRAPSLSKDMHPVFAGIVVAAAIAVAVVNHLRRRNASTVH
jgi:hypothetical protein